jgi:hypothetical protein
MRTLFIEVMKYLRSNNRTSHGFIIDHIIELVNKEIIDVTNCKSREIRRKIELDICEILAHLVILKIITQEANFENLQRTIVNVKDIKQLERILEYI